MRDVVKRTKLTENCSKKTIKKYVDEVIQELTLDEKIGVMSGQVTEKKLLDDLFLIEHYNVKPYPTKAVERLGIPNIRFVDGPRGVVAGSATCFPVSMARGASFDRDLEEKIGEVIGAEVRAVGGNYYGGVCINLPRNPRWGRAQECYGEDTYHLGEMGAALTRGVQSQNVMACIKHFAMNSIENARFKADVHADKRTLFEVYLPHFKRCIEEGAASVMGAYNKVYGEQASESKYLLKDILRDKWGFEGFTLSDFLWAVKDGPKAVKSGMNVEMPCICHYAEQIPKAIEDGTLAMEDVDEAVQKFSQGALEHVTLYSIMQDPMTSCGCFECICGIEPFSNGVVIANREYAGMTPLGMTFSEMASMTGGGVQTPGFMGHGKHFISSKKFMKAEGGIERIVWMPKELKEFVAERLNKTAQELYGIENFTDMIGDETVAEDPETLVAFLTEKGHPALGMDPMM